MKYLLKIIIFLSLPPYVLGAFLEGPYVGNVKSDSVVIWWKSNPPISGKVFFENKVFERPSPPFQITINGLKPDTAYRYHVVFSNGKRAPENGYYRFYTAPEKEKRFRFAVMADSRGLFSMIPVRKDILKKMFEDAVKRKVSFICFLGDLVYGCAEREEELRKQLRLWKEIVSFAMHEIPVYTVMGNHDVVLHEESSFKGKYMLDGAMKNNKIITSEEIFADEFVNPENSPEPEFLFAPPYKETCYSFDWGNSHFVFINMDYWIALPKKRIFKKERLDLYKKGNPPGIIMEKQLRWIEADIKKARDNKKHIFVFGHHPIFSISETFYMTEPVKKIIKNQQKKLWNIFTNYKVKAFFCGHEHNYSRSLIKGIWQIVTGGAGAPLYKGLRKDLPGFIEIRKFEKRYHYCIVSINGDKVFLDVYGLKKDMKGFELIDHAEL